MFLSWLGLPFEEVGDGGAEGGFEDGGFGVGDGDGDFAEGFVCGGLAGDGHEVGGSFWIVAGGEFAGTGCFFGLVEEFGLGEAALEDGECGAEV